MNKRINWIDVAKGFLIILVVLGHSNITNTTAIFINSFHMAAFFFLSGITFSLKNDTITFIKKKFKSLLLPYFAFSILLLVFQFVKSVVFGGSSFNLISGIISIFIPISGRESTTVYGLWFLPCLFLTELVLYLFFLIKGKSKTLSVFYIVFIYLICIGLFLITNISSILSILPISLFFCALGYLAKSVDLFSKLKNLVFLICSAGLFAISVILNAYLSKSSFDLSSMNLGVWPLYILSGIAGTVFICLVAMFAEKSKFLQMMGKNSLYYYGLHYLFIGIIEKVVNVKWGGYSPNRNNLYHFNSNSFCI